MKARALKANKCGACNGAVALSFHGKHLEGTVPDPGRPPNLAKRAQPKSHRDGMEIAQGGGLGGLALGYYRAAPPGRRTTTAALVCPLPTVAA